MFIKNLSYILIIFFTLIIVSSLHANKKQSYEEAYATMLSKHVRDGEKQGIKTTLVDYNSWGQDALHQQVMALLQQNKPELLHGKDKMAFWINAYNLLTIDLIIKTGEKESIKNQRSLFKNVWKSHDWLINGKHYTLDEIEHQILRPMSDARIHFAINCASLSCPDLRAQPYTSEKLESQLEEQTKLFRNYSEVIAHKSWPLVPIKQPQTFSG